MAFVHYFGWIPIYTEPTEDRMAGIPAAQHSRRRRRLPVPSALFMRLTRSSMLEVLRQDYIRTARAKGASYTHGQF